MSIELLENELLENELDNGIFETIFFKETEYKYDFRLFFLRDGWVITNISDISDNFDASLKYIDAEYEEFNKLYHNLFKGYIIELLSITKKKEKIINFIEDNVAPPIVSASPSLTEKSLVNLTGGAEHSYGEDFMPESYYHKQKSELIIEYLIFISEKSFTQFQKLCIYLFNIIFQVVLKLLKHLVGITSSILKLIAVNVINFILMNYLKPLSALFESLNPFKTSLGNNENDMATQILENKEKIATLEKSLLELEQSLQDTNIKNDYDQTLTQYTWLFDKFLTLVSGPVLMAIQHHVIIGGNLGNIRIGNT